MSRHWTLRAFVPEYVAGFYRLLTYHRRYPEIEIHPTARVRSDCILQHPAVVGAWVQLYAVEAGSFLCVGEEANMENVRLGRFCSIASRASIGGGTHPSRDWVSTSPAFFSAREQAGLTFATEEQFPEIPSTTLGNDVWVGHGATILPGLEVGDGAIIGAGAVVTHNVEAFDIVAGVPARRIRKRFTDQDCRFLAELRWWDWDHKLLSEAATSFRSVTNLKSFLRGRQHRPPIGCSPKPSGCDPLPHRPQP